MEDSDKTHLISTIKELGRLMFTIPILYDGKLANYSVCQLRVIRNNRQWAKKVEIAYG
jgi:hypothetical protein